MLTKVAAVSLCAINLQNNLPIHNILILFLDGVVKAICQKMMNGGNILVQTMKLGLMTSCVFIMTTLILVLFLHNSHFCHLKNLHHAIPSCFVDC
jgi:hypothetical protein